MPDRASYPQCSELVGLIEIEPVLGGSPRDAAVTESDDRTLASLFARLARGLVDAAAIEPPWQSKGPRFLDESVVGVVANCHRLRGELARVARRCQGIGPAR